MPPFARLREAAGAAGRGIRPLRSALTRWRWASVNAMSASPVPPIARRTAPIARGVAPSGPERLRGARRPEQDGGGEDGEDVKHPLLLTSCRRAAPTRSALRYALERLSRNRVRTGVPR